MKFADELPENDNEVDDALLDDEENDEEDDALDYEDEDDEEEEEYISPIIDEPEDPISPTEG